ncbi:MAG: hypothetical protein GX554_01745 [Elusimicrobia bacterium]|nr:hypothetical protein [Elusimicrobiota bacterium]
MKITLRFIRPYFVFACILMFTVLGYGEDFFQDQVFKLANAAWKESPSSFDILMYREVKEQPQSEETIRSAVEKLYKATDQAAVNTTPNARKAEMEAEVQRIMREQQLPRFMKQHIRIKGEYLYRVDETIIPSGQTAIPNSAPVTRTFVNYGNPSKADYTHFEYDHVAKIATLFNDQSMWRREYINEWCDMPQDVKDLLQYVFGVYVKDVDSFIPDANLINQVVKGTREGIKISFDSVKYGDDQRTALQINIILSNFSSNPIFSIICDPTDYNRVYRYERYNFSDCSLNYVRECDKFNSQGFPMVVNIFNYIDGKVSDYDKNTVEKVNLNSNVSDDIFKFNPPVEYGIIDRSLPTPLAIEPYDRM